MVTRILVDWGGTIIRDAALFNKIAAKSRSSKSFDGPESWESIRSVGTVNYFNSINDRFFFYGDVYDSAVETINSFYNREGMASRSLVYVVFDDKPRVSGFQAEIQLSRALEKKGVKFNGLFINSDKVGLAKKLGVEIVIEDDPRTALALSSAGIRCFLVSRLWNRKFDMDNHLSIYVPFQKKEVIQKNLTLVEDWQDVRDQIDKILEHKTQNTKRKT